MRLEFLVTIFGDFHVFRALKIKTDDFLYYYYTNPAKRQKLKINILPTTVYINPESNLGICLCNRAPLLSENLKKKKKTPASHIAVLGDIFLPHEKSVEVVFFQKG